MRESPELGASLQQQAAAAFASMRSAAASDGLQLYVASGFRDFERQTAIWNAKFRGERTLIDRNGRALERRTLDDHEAIDAILAWSALPGASRHHWGSDCDVIDTAAVPTGYHPQLQSFEFAPGGVFARLSRWLEANAARFGFFRPYVFDRGGVMPEPWHLSYAPLAIAAQAALSLETLASAVAQADIEGREAIRARLPELYERFVCNVEEPPFEARSG